MSTQAKLLAQLRHSGTDPLTLLRTYPNMQAEGLRLLLHFPKTEPALKLCHRLLREAHQTLATPIPARLASHAREIAASVVKIPLRPISLPPDDDPAHPALPSISSLSPEKQRARLQALQDVASAVVSISVYAPVDAPSMLANLPTLKPHTPHPLEESSTIIATSGPLTGSTFTEPPVSLNPSLNLPDSRGRVRALHPVDYVAHAFHTATRKDGTLIRELTYPTTLSKG